MRRITRFSRPVLAPITAVLVVLGVAGYAFFTSTAQVSGSGTAQVSDQVPGESWLYLSVNGKDASQNVVPIRVDTNKGTTVYVRGKNESDVSRSVPSALPAPVINRVVPQDGVTCPAGSFEVIGMRTYPDVTIPALQSRMVGEALVKFNNLAHANQDGCLNATVHLTWEPASGSANAQATNAR